MDSELHDSTIFRLAFRGRYVIEVISANVDIAQQEGVSMAIEEKERSLRSPFDSAPLEVHTPKNRVAVVGGAAATVDELRKVIQDEFAEKLDLFPDGGHLVINLLLSGEVGNVTSYGTLGQQAEAKVRHLLEQQQRSWSVEPSGTGSPVADRQTVSTNSPGPSAAQPEAAKCAADAAAAASSSADLPGPDGLLSPFMGLAIALAASPGSTTMPDFDMPPIDSIQPPLSTHHQEGLSTVSDSQKPSAAESLRDAATPPRDKQLQAPPNSNMPSSSAVERMQRSSLFRRYLFQGLQDYFLGKPIFAIPKLTVDVQCTRLSAVVADAYILPMHCGANFTRDMQAAEFYSSISLRPPVGNRFLAGTCLAQRLSFGALSDSYGIFVAVPDRGKLGNSAKKLCLGIHHALTTADERAFWTVAMLPLGVYCDTFAPDDAAKLTYRVILNFCQTRKDVHLRRLIVAVPETDLLQVYRNAFSRGFDVASLPAESSKNASVNLGNLTPEVAITLCGTESRVLAAVSRLVEKVAVGSQK